MEENQYNMNIDSELENVRLMRQLSDELQQITINQIENQDGMGTSESGSVKCSSNDDSLKAMDDSCVDECEKSPPPASNDIVETDQKVSLCNIEKMEIEEALKDMPSTSKEQDHTNSAELILSPTKNKNGNYCSYSNLVKKCCSNCKITLDIINDKCHKCQIPLHYQCNKCQSLYKNYAGMISHIKYECYKLPKYCCHFCNYTTYLRLNLVQHTQKVHKTSLCETEYQCPFCQKKFKDYTLFTRHEVICSKETTLVCEYCPYRTKLHQLLTQHMQKKHKKGTLLNNHRCPDCGKKHNDLKSLEQHTKFTCSIKKVFQCDHCDFKINKRYAIVKHVHDEHRSFYDKMKLSKN